MSFKTIQRALYGFAGALAAIASGEAGADWKLNFQDSVTPIGDQIYDLHMTVLWVVTIIGIGVFGLMIYSIFKHRKSKGVTPAQFHESTAVEVVWTVVPFLILIGIAIPATGTLIQMEDNSEADINIKVTGYQWRWKYDYLDQDISFYSTLSTPRDAINGAKDKGEHYLLEVDNELVVPVGKKIRFLLTANDVLHAWWVPALGVKKDTIPGFINETHATIMKPGVYRGQCAELCGRDHGFMPIVVRAVSEEEFAAWVAEQRSAKTAAADQASANLLASAADATR